MKNTFLRILVVVIALLTGIQAGVFAYEFPDVSSSHRNFEAVDYLSEIGVIAGYEDGTFCPEREITRTEFCALMARTLGYNKETHIVKKLPFSDVASGYWGIGFISYCYERGLRNGMGDGTFAPADKVTVGQAVKMSVCAAGLEKKALKIKGDKWYSGYMKVADNYGLLDYTIQEADENANRANVAQIVYNMRMSGMVDIETEETGKPEDTELEEEEKEPVDENEDISDEEELPEEELSELEKLFAEKDYTDVKVIVIDAGHNPKGFDKGAYNGEEDIWEQDVTWEIADKLRGYLEKMGYTVVMTREKKSDSIGNTSLQESLQARVDLAHESEADLFIAIHCNMGGGTGTETYCYQLGGYAARLATIVQKKITKATGLYSRGVKTANFYVNKNTLMPAILIETGFLDNNEDLKVLLSEDGQDAMAEAIAEAVEEYDAMEPLPKRVVEPEVDTEEEAQEEDENDEKA